MKTVILCGGAIDDYGFCNDILRSADCIICADGGTRHAVNMNIIPNVIIGDLDSSKLGDIEYFRKKGVDIIQYPVKKDKTDSHLCIEFAIPFSKEIILLGATGSRIDHVLANISLLKLGLNSNIPISIIDNHNDIRMINGSTVMKEKKGEVFSLIAFTEKVDGISTKGAYYELHDASMEQGNPYGVSNCFKQDTVEISINSGVLLVIKSSD
jgi:thiamine pyrophosphokinase